MSKAGDPVPTPDYQQHERRQRHRETLLEIRRMQWMANHWKKLSRPSRRFILALLADRFDKGLGRVVDQAP